VATYDLGGTGPELLIAHATGFHGRCYLPLAGALADRFHATSFDFRGHGDTPRPDGVPFVWPRIADDAEAVACRLAGPRAGPPTAFGGPLTGFGHSMGGACLLLVAARWPELFGELVLFEPIVYPPGRVGGPNPLSIGARRRRASFPSYAAAIANYSAKPPLSGFTVESLDAYVRFGFRPGPEGVHLKCRPEDEGDTFEAADTSGAWDVLAEIEVPTTVIGGTLDHGLAASMAEGVADRLPRGRYLYLPELDHFGPMTDPHVVADLIRSPAS
jgi:pimeloyl-ACP methyl ester carboxylesterase